MDGEQAYAKLQALKQQDPQVTEAAQRAREEQLLAQAAEQLAAGSADDVEWSAFVMDYIPRGWCAVEVSRRAHRAGAAIYAPATHRDPGVDPSLNRYFLESCIQSFGARPVWPKLRAYRSQGTNVEKAGAVTAL